MMQQHNQMSQKNLHRAPAGSHHQQQPQQYYATSWGLASKGQLGYVYHSIKSMNAGQISPLERNENFSDISCGENHTLFLTDGHELVSCGSNTYG